MSQANAIIQSAAYALFKVSLPLLPPLPCSHCDHSQSPHLSQSLRSKGLSSSQRHLRDKDRDAYISLSEMSTPSPSKLPDAEPSDEGPTGPIHPLEHLVKTISRLVDQFNTPTPHSQLLVPLGVLRVLQATVNKQVPSSAASPLFS
jgi:hypothetical protein